MQRSNLAIVRRRNRHSRFVGHHIDQIIVFGDYIPDRDVPLHDLAFYNSFSDIRQFEHSI
tara:strand:- start:4114 stop:4293 length:180 start_codon:yes stop_codon:yes gene_type:complete